MKREWCLSKMLADIDQSSTPGMQTLGIPGPSSHGQVDARDSLSSVTGMFSDFM